MVDSPAATLRVPENHPVFVGHFPGMPLVPGVMLLEWILREASRALGIEPHDLRIRESKFLAPLRPEEEAELFLAMGPQRHVFRICRGPALLVSGVLERK